MSQYAKIIPMISSIRKHIPLLLIIVLFVGLASILLGQSFWFEETWQAVSGLGFADILANLQPPLFYLVLNFAAIFSYSEWWLRLWTALIPSVLSIWGIYVLAKKISTRAVAILCSLFLATNSLFIYHAQELGPYALTTLFVIWSWMLLLEHTGFGKDSFKIKRSSTTDKLFKFFPISHDLFLFLLCSILGLYTSYFYFFVLASQLIYLVIKKYYRSLGWTAFICTIIYLPWLPSMYRQIEATQTLQTAFPGFENIIGFSIMRAPALTFGRFVFGMPDISISLFYLLTLAILAIITTLLLFSYSKKDFKLQKNNLALVAFMLLMPALLTWLASLFFPALQPRRVLFLLPFFYLTLSFFLLGIKLNIKLKKKKIASPIYSYLAVLVFLFINGYGVLSYLNNPALQREDWRGVIAEVKKETPQEQTLILFAYNNMLPPWRWYAETTGGKTYAVLSTQSYNLDLEQGSFANIAPLINNYRFVVVFDYLRALTDQSNLLIETLEDNGYKVWREIDRPGVGRVTIFISGATIHASLVEN